jgi:hypothetical protein
MAALNEQESESFQISRAEYQRLRDLVISLSATLLRTIALDSASDRRAISSIDAERYLRKAEDCFRCASMPSLKIEIAEGLKAAGHAFMAKTVEIEAMLQREKWKSRDRFAAGVRSKSRNKPSYPRASLS